MEGSGSSPQGGGLKIDSKAAGQALVKQLATAVVDSQLEAVKTLPEAVEEERNNRVSEFQAAVDAAIAKITETSPVFQLS